MNLGPNLDSDDKNFLGFCGDVNRIQIREEILDFEDEDIFEFRSGAVDERDR